MSSLSLSPLTAGTLTLVAQTQGLAAFLSAGIANVTAYGASPSASAATNRTAIQAALNAVPSGGGIVYLPPGTFNINAALFFATSGTILCGPGTINQTDPTLNGISYNSGVSGLTVSGVTITNSCTAATSGVQGLVVPGNSLVDAVTMGGWNINIGLQDTGNSRVRSCRLTSAVGTGSGQGYGVLVLAPDCVVEGNRMALIGRHGVYCSGNATFGGALRAAVTGNVLALDGAVADAIKCFATTGQTGITGVSIVGNTIIHTNTTGSAGGIGIYETCSDIVVVGNTISGTDSAGLKVAATSIDTPTRIVLSGNSVNAASGFFVKLEVSGANKPGNCLVVDNVTNLNSATAIQDSGSGTNTFANNQGPGFKYPDSEPFQSLNTATATPSVYAGNDYTAAASATAVTGLANGRIGQKVRVTFTGVRTFTNGASLKLAGAVDFSGTADDILTLELGSDGTTWREVSRSVN